LKKTLEIIKKGTVDPSFFKANKFLIDSHNTELVLLSDEKKKEFIKNLWKDHFHAEVISSIEDPHLWTHLDFFTENDFVLFLMKWNG
jgi:oligoribonuclease NrnB/cAMP/cGMP phosphodiesterase (DHH superfamily)